MSDFSFFLLNQCRLLIHSAVWNTHSRITKPVAEGHIQEWAALTPPVEITSPLITPSTTAYDTPDLDTPDELAIRALLLGIVHRTAGDHAAARAFLQDAAARQPAVRVSSWVGGVAWFELAVLDLKEFDAGQEAKGRETSGLDADTEGWTRVLKSALEKLDKALSLATQQVDLSSRLDTRIAMLKDEITMKKEMLGIVS